MRILANPKLFADLGSNLGIVTLYDSITESCSLLVFNFSNALWKFKLYNTETFVDGPWSEPSSLSIVISSCKMKFWSNQKHLLVENE
jgi:hypothetical protein